MTSQEKSNGGIKKKRGRPLGAKTVMIRAQTDTVAMVEAWADAQPNRPSRVEALAELIRRGLGTDD